MAKKASKITADVAQLTGQIKSAYTQNVLKEFPLAERANYLNYKVIPIELLIKADWNYKEQDEFTGERLRNNIKRVGQVENVQVRLLKTGYYEVINGNHRLDEMNTLGRKSVLCYDHGVISDAAARRIAIETNETKFKTDLEKLRDIIGELVEEYEMPDLMDTLPYDEDYINKLLQSEDGEVDNKIIEGEQKWFLNIEFKTEKECQKWYDELLKKKLSVKIVQ